MSKTEENKKRDFGNTEDLVPADSEFRKKLYENITPSRLATLIFCERDAWLRHNGWINQTKRMTVGRRLHDDTAKFNRQWTRKITESRRMKRHQLHKLLKSTRDKIVIGVKRDRYYRRKLQALLKNLSCMIEESAREITRNNRFNTQDLISSFWGGIPRFEYPPKTRGCKARADVIGVSNDYFIVHELKTGRTPINPYEAHIIQAVATGMELELYPEMRGKKCTEVRIMYPEKIFAITISDRHRSRVDYQRGAYNAICSLPIPPPAKKSTKCEGCGQLKVCQRLDEDIAVKVGNNLITGSGESLVKSKSKDQTSVHSVTKSPDSKTKHNDHEDYLGNVIQNRKYPFILKHGKENEIWVKIREKCVDLVKSGDLTILEDENMPIKLFTEVLEVRSFPDTATLSYRSTSELVNFAKLNPHLEIHPDGSRTPPSGRNYSNYIMRKAKPEEIAKYFSLSNTGLPFGIIDSGNGLSFEQLSPDALPYLYPIERANQLYKGIFIAGSPGKGKSNFLKLMMCGIADYIGCKIPPALIVFDIEGDFADLDLPTTGSEFDQDFWSRFKLQPVSQLNRYTISKMGLAGDTTLRFELIDPRDISLLFPTLPEKSRQIFEQVTRHIMNDYPISTFVDFREALKFVIENFKGNFEYPLNVSQRDAILRASYSDIEDIFDQEGEYLDIEQLITPGNLSVIDCSGLCDNRLARQVALYLFLVIKKHKISIKNRDQPVVIVFDEAHEIFPRISKNEEEMDYLRRVTKQVEQILRLGRKRKYGFVFATQYPQDVSKDIVDFCQTKVIMGLENESWISKILGSKWVRKIRCLKRGQALIDCPEFHPKAMQIRVPKAPCKHDS